MLNVVLGESLEHQRLFTQAAVGFEDLLGKRTTRRRSAWARVLPRAGWSSDRRAAPDIDRARGHRAREQSRRPAGHADGRRGSLRAASSPRSTSRALTKRPTSARAPRSRRISTPRQWGRPRSARRPCSTRCSRPSASSARAPGHIRTRSAHARPRSRFCIGLEITTRRGSWCAASALPSAPLRAGAARRNRVRLDRSGDGPHGRGVAARRWTSEGMIKKGRSRRPLNS